ncbi:cation:proton antiporter domain-containing protein [Arcanobacterium canis]
MEIGIELVVAIALVAFSTIVAGKVGVASPLILLAIGTAISFIPGLSVPEIGPELILEGFLPPLLFAIAWHTPVVDLRRHLLPVSILAVVLVGLTAFSVGIATSALIPGLGLTWAVALGAAIPRNSVARDWWPPSSPGSLRGTVHHSRLARKLV